MDVLVFAEHQDGHLEPSVHQLVAAGREIAGRDEVAALVLSAPGAQVVEQAQTVAVDRVYAVGDALLSEYCPEAFAKVAAESVSRIHPGVFVCAHSFQGMEIAPWIAGRLGLRLISNCFDLCATERALTARRKVYGSAWEVGVEVSLERTVVATLARRGKAGSRETAAPAPVEEVQIDLAGLDIRSRAAGVVVPEAGDGDITRADVVVGIGRGIRDPANLAMIEELADALGGVVACSRPLVDLEWMPHAKQVGASGQEIAPKVYIACGISGAAQHLAGIRGARTIVAINKDAKAPIFGLSDYGVVGDLFEVVPALTAETRTRRDQ